MDDPATVRFVQCSGDPRRYAQRFADRQGASAKPGRERFTLKMFHDEEMRPGMRSGNGRLADVIKRADVRIVERGDVFRFAVESLDELRIRGERGRQDFDGHDAIEPAIPGFVDLAHPPGAEGRLDLIRTEERDRRQVDIRAGRGLYQQHRPGDALLLGDIKVYLRHADEVTPIATDRGGGGGGCNRANDVTKPRSSAGWNDDRCKAAAPNRSARGGAMRQARLRTRAPPRASRSRRPCAPGWQRNRVNYTAGRLQAQECAGARKTCAVRAAVETFGGAPAFPSGPFVARSLYGAGRAHEAQ